MRDSGVLFICELTNIAENGNMPVQALKKAKKYWFEMRTVGVSRSYQAKGVNEQVDMLVRIPKDIYIRIGQYAMLGNGEQFRIDNVSHGKEVIQRTKMVDSKYYRQPVIEGLEYTELTLSRLEQNYAIEVDED